MTIAEPRPAEVRKADALALLQAENADVWVATAGADDGTPRPHLVPVSLAWHHDRAVIAVKATARTAQDLQQTRTARLAVGPTRDVVMIDAELETVTEVTDAGELGEVYARQADWDPRTSAGYLFLTLRPVRVQAWREANEIEGRTLMRDGKWLV